MCFSPNEQVVFDEKMHVRLPPHQAEAYVSLRPWRDAQERVKRSHVEGLRGLADGDVLLQVDYDNIHNIYIYIIFIIVVLLQYTVYDSCNKVYTV